MPPAAAALFDEGRAALQRRDWDFACAKFAASERLDPAIGTQFNLANCEEERGRLATAWVMFLACRIRRACSASSFTREYERCLTFPIAP